MRLTRASRGDGSYQVAITLDIQLSCLFPLIVKALMTEPLATPHLRDTPMHASAAAAAAACDVGCACGPPSFNIARARAAPASASRVPGPPADQPPCSDATGANRTVGGFVSFRVGNRSRGRFATPISLSRIVARTLRHTPRKFGSCPSFKDPFLSPRAEPVSYDSHLFMAVHRRDDAP